MRVLWYALTHPWKVPNSIQIWFQAGRQDSGPEGLGYRMPTDLHALGRLSYFLGGKSNMGEKEKA